jgi:hypothetical protein
MNQHASANDLHRRSKAGDKRSVGGTIHAARANRQASIAIDPFDPIRTAVVYGTGAVQGPPDLILIDMI